MNLNIYILKNRGFTLMELMIVIAIIGVLSGALFTVFTGYMARSRDTARISHLGQLSTAMTTFYTDRSFYPAPIWLGIPGCVDSGAIIVYMYDVPSDPGKLDTPPCSGSPGSYAYATGVNDSLEPAFAVAAKMEEWVGMILTPIQSFTWTLFNKYTKAKRGDIFTPWYSVMAR